MSADNFHELHARGAPCSSLTFLRSTKTLDELVVMSFNMMFPPVSVE